MTSSAIVDSTNDSVAVGAATGAFTGGLAADYKNRQRKKRVEAKQLIEYFSIVVDIQLRERTTGIVEISGSFSKFSSVLRPAGA